MAEEQLAPLEFPANGLDLTQGFGAQRPGTTPVGTNVRTFETLTQRGRGGSRQGLSRYVLPQLPTAAKIQCLDYVVDPSADALLASFGNGNSSDPGILDPSTNPPGSMQGDGRFRNPGNQWRTGGSGIQPNRNVKLKINNPVSGTVTATPTSVPGDGMTPSLITVNVQDRYGFPVTGDTIVLSTSPSGRVGDGVSGTTDGFGNFETEVTDNQGETVTYTARDTTKNVTIGSASVNYGSIMFVQLARRDAQLYTNPVTLFGVGKNHLLVAFVRTAVTLSVAAPTVSMSDDMGNTWHQIGGYVTDSFNFDMLPTKRNTISAWYAVALSDGDVNVTAALSDNTAPHYNQSQFVVLEYQGLNSTSPFTASSSNTGNVGSPVPPPPGIQTATVSAGGGSGKLSLVALSADAETTGAFVADGAWTVRDQLAGGSAYPLDIYDQINAPGPVTATDTFTNPDGMIVFDCIGIEFTS